MTNPNTNSSKHGNKLEWLQQHDLMGKIGEGTLGLVFLARINPPSANRGKFIAIKKFKQSRDGDGVSPTAIREIMVISLLSPRFPLPLRPQLRSQSYLHFD